MAEAAVARSQAEIVSRIIASSNLLDYSFLVSTNFISPYGFNASLPQVLSNPTNVNYERVLGGGLMSANSPNWLRNIANLQYDPRPPVFIQVTNDPRVPLDFRFYFDLNRNGRFESNGVLPQLSADGRWLNTNRFIWRAGDVVLSNAFVGDPEWVSMLQHPAIPTRRPIGSSGAWPISSTCGQEPGPEFHGQPCLRLNDTRLQLDGYYRNQGSVPGSSTSPRSCATLPPTSPASITTGAWPARCRHRGRGRPELTSLPVATICRACSRWRRFTNGPRIPFRRTSLTATRMAPRSPPPAPGWLWTMTCHPRPNLGRR
jgi:hypothetical protein